MRRIISLVLKKRLLQMVIFSLSLAACSPSSPEQVSTQPAETTQAPVEETTAPAQPPQGEQTGNLVIEASDPCALLTGEQVEVAFGWTVSEVAPGGPGNTSQFSQGCDFVISEYSKINVNIYQGDGAKNYYALLITAAGQSCDELFERFFDLTYVPLAEKYPSADASLLTLTLGDLYRRYVGVLGECIYIHSQDRPDVGANVMATETIFLETSSNVAVIDQNRVIEFIYQEAFSPELEQALQQATSQEAFYVIADPYRQEVLSGYTDKLIGLVKQAAGQ